MPGNIGSGAQKEGPSGCGNSPSGNAKGSLHCGEHIGWSRDFLVGKKPIRPGRLAAEVQGHFAFFDPRGVRPR